MRINKRGEGWQNLKDIRGSEKDWKPIQIPFCSG
jgi:hypothetical protein